jgi:hypothetical protein
LALDGRAVDAGKRRIQPDDAQVAIDEAEADRRRRMERLEQREVLGRLTLSLLQALRQSLLIFGVDGSADPRDGVMSPRRTSPKITPFSCVTRKPQTVEDNRALSSPKCVVRIGPTG